MRREMWMKHDVRSRLDPKMSKFILLTGATGYGFFWVVIETLHYQRDHKLHIKDDLPALASTLLLSDGEIFRLSALAISLRLFSTDGDFLWQSRLLEDEQKRNLVSEETREKRRLAGKKGGEASVAKRSKMKQNQAKIKKSILLDFASIENPSKTQPFASSNPSETLDSSSKMKQSQANQPEENRYIDIDTNVSISNKKQNKFCLNFCFPKLWGEKSQNALKDWIEYRAQIKKPLKQKSLQAQINHYASDPKTFIALVERAIINGWQGLNNQLPLDITKNNSPTMKKSQNLINQERSVNAVAQILEECGHETGRNKLDVGESGTIDAEFHSDTGDDKGVV